MQIGYDNKVITSLRCKVTPKIIIEAFDYYLYSDNRYQLGDVIISRPRLNLDHKLLSMLVKNLKKTVSIDKFGYETYTLSFDGSDSYFTFLHTPQVQNLEKTKYNVNSLEELFVFVQTFKKIARELKTRYLEVFVSAYLPEHQKIFLDCGLSPRGYVPSWTYDKEGDCFKDTIVFNYFEGDLDKNIALIDDATVFKSLVTQSCARIIKY